MWGSRLFPLPWLRSSQLPLPCPVVTDSGLNTTRGRTPSSSSERASGVARPGPGCECITQRERLPGRGDLAGRGGRADRSQEGGVACLRGTGMETDVCWSRVVRATPGSASVKAGKGRGSDFGDWEASRARNLNAGRGRDWRAGVTVQFTSLGQTLPLTAHWPCRLINRPPYSPGKGLHSRKEIHASPDQEIPE